MSNQRNDSERLVLERREKAFSLRSKGVNLFENKVSLYKLDICQVIQAVSHFKVPNTVDRYNSSLLNNNKEELEFTVAGRIIFFRMMGAVSFLRIRDVTGEIQIYFQDSLDTKMTFSMEDLDIGDCIEVTGRLTSTIKGELSISPKEVRLLTKSFRALPTKSAIKDTELRYRQRYVDLVVNDQSRDILYARSVILRAIRRKLENDGFVEVETPNLHSVLGGANAKPFVTHHNVLEQDFYLRIAPELYLKRLVVGGVEKVFEIGKCFRNEGLSSRHNPEFTLLECYQAYATYQHLIFRIREIFSFVDFALSQQLGVEKFDLFLLRRKFILDQDFVQLSMIQVLQKALKKHHLPENFLEILQQELQINTWTPVIKSLTKSVPKERKIDWKFLEHYKTASSTGAQLFCAYEYLAEPFLTQDYRTEDNKYSLPIFITEYPVEVSPLARELPDKPGFTGRFELFIDGKEVANGFDELNDPDEQRRRFQEQLDQKQAGNEEAMEMDEDYIRALEYGMPPTAGFGIGIDRLVMLLTGADFIKEVIAFPSLKKEG